MKLQRGGIEILVVALLAALIAVLALPLVPRDKVPGGAIPGVSPEDTKEIPQVGASGPQ